MALQVKRFMSIQAIILWDNETIKRSKNSLGYHLPLSTFPIPFNNYLEVAEKIDMLAQKI